MVDYKKVALQGVFIASVIVNALLLSLVYKIDSEKNTSVILNKDDWVRAVKYVPHKNDKANICGVYAMTVDALKEYDASVN